MPNLYYDNSILICELRPYLRNVMKLNLSK